MILAKNDGVNKLTLSIETLGTTKENSEIENTFATQKPIPTATFRDVASDFSGHPLKIRKKSIPGLLPYIPEDQKKEIMQEDFKETGDSDDEESTGMEEDEFVTEEEFIKSTDMKGLKLLKERFAASKKFANSKLISLKKEIEDLRAKEKEAEILEASARAECFEDLKSSNNLYNELSQTGEELTKLRMKTKTNKKLRKRVKRKKVCRYFQRHGYCKKGRSCRFKHSLDGRPCPNHSNQASSKFCLGRHSKSTQRPHFNFSFKKIAKF